QRPLARAALGRGGVLPGLAIGAKWPARQPVFLRQLLALEPLRRARRFPAPARHSAGAAAAARLAAERPQAAAGRNQQRQRLAA
nr:hypothetical protein [Tanacetum cinerariifolium]